MFRLTNPFKRPRSLGVDLGSHSLKWAVLDGRRELVKSGSTTLFPERQHFSQSFDWHLWEGRVLRAMEQIPQDLSALHAVVQGNTTAYGYLEFPALSEDELRVAAHAEAQQSIPFPADKIQFSYTRVPPLTGAGGMGVFYAAALLAEVLLMRQILSRAGLVPQRIEIPALALAREFLLNHRPPAGHFYAIVHVGYRLTQYILVRDGFPYYARDFVLGAAHFTRALQAARGVTWLEAEKSLQVCDFRAADLGAPLTRLVDGLQRTRAHGERLTQAPPAGIYLSGGCAVSNLAATLGERLQLPVVLDSWLNISGGSAPPTMYKLATGLALP